MTEPVPSMWDEEFWATVDAVRIELGTDEPQPDGDVMTATLIALGVSALFWVILIAAVVVFT